MDLVWEWQRANGLRPGSPLSYREYEEMVRSCWVCAWTHTRDDGIDELLDRLDGGRTP